MGDSGVDRNGIRLCCMLIYQRSDRERARASSKNLNSRPFFLSHPRLCEPSARRFDFQRVGSRASWDLRLVNIVLLPMQRRIRLNHNALPRSLLKVLNQRSLARLKRLGDFRVDAQSDGLRVEVGGHFFGLGLDLVADEG